MNQKKTRNKPTIYDISVTFRSKSENFEEFKKTCEIKGTNYSKVLRELMDYYTRTNS